MHDTTRTPNRPIDDLLRAICRDRQDLLRIIREMEVVQSAYRRAYTTTLADMETVIARLRRQNDRLRAGRLDVADLIDANEALRAEVDRLSGELMTCRIGRAA